jgi:transposase
VRARGQVGARRRAKGSVAAQKVGGGKPVLLEAERGWLVTRIEQVKDLTLHELLAQPRDVRGVAGSQALRQDI